MSSPSNAESSCIVMMNRSRSAAASSRSRTGVSSAGERRNQRMAAPLQDHQVVVLVLRGAGLLGAHRALEGVDQGADAVDLLVTLGLVRLHVLGRVHRHREIV